MAVGASAFALFTKNQRQWFSTPLQQTEIEKFKAEVLKSGIEARYILPHDSYLINLGSPDPEGLEKSRASFLEGSHREHRRTRLQHGFRLLADQTHNRRCGR